MERLEIVGEGWFLFETEKGQGVAVWKRSGRAYVQLLRRAKHKYLIKNACGNCGNPYGNILGGGGGGLLKHGYELLCGNSA